MGHHHPRDEDIRLSNRRHQHLLVCLLSVLVVSYFYSSIYPSIHLARSLVPRMER